MTLLQLLSQADSVGRAVALLLLAMSVASWVVILWKAWLLRRASADVARGVTAFWSAPDLGVATGQLLAFDRERLVLPLVQATAPGLPGTLAAAGDRAQQLTRALRDALHRVLARLQFGQVLLATVGSTAPFVGLLGTVWGIYHALSGLTGATQVTIDRLAGPVGEALVMTALGLFVAIPAVLGYNAIQRGNRRVVARLNRFAHELHAHFVTGARVTAAPTKPSQAAAAVTTPPPA